MKVLQDSEARLSGEGISDEDRSRLPFQFGPWPFFADDECTAVARVLRSGKVNYWTGEEGKNFEHEFASYFHRQHAIALANGTLALDLALRVMGLGKGDEVVVPPRTYMATASSVVLAGATPVFADIDGDSGNVTTETIAAVVTDKTKAIMPVHLGGWPCDMPAIMQFAKDRNLKVIEDCAQAHGAFIGKQPVGSFGDMAAFSFCQDKIMTTGGEGGMLVLDDESQWKAAWAYKDHGKSYDTVHRKDHPPGFRWLHESFGTNWRLTEMQSAIGRLQLRKLDQWIEARNRNAQLLATCLAQFPCMRVPMPAADIRHAYYKLYAYVRPEQLVTGWDRDRIMNAIVAEGAPCFSGSCSEVYREKAFSNAGLGPPERLPVARELGETSLMFLVHPTLSEEELRQVCRAISKVLELAQR